jgi:hypothetical protein
MDTGVWATLPSRSGGLLREHRGPQLREAGPASLEAPLPDENVGVAWTPPDRHRRRRPRRGLGIAPRRGQPPLGPGRDRGCSRLHADRPWRTSLVQRAADRRHPRISRGGSQFRELGRQKALVGLRDRFSIDLENGGELKAKGNIVDHEYEVERDGDTVATVSKRWFRVRDTYGVEIAPDEDDALILAITVCVDAMTDRGD